MHTWTDEVSLPNKIVENLGDQIGTRLRQAREQAGLSVEDVVFRTQLPRTVIVALEDSDFTVFSSPTYAKSFLSQYSNFLSVDAYVWIDALQPAPFVASEAARSFLEVVGPKTAEKTTEPTSSSGLLSALSILVFSFGMIYAAMKGYDFFEARFGRESISNLPGKNAGGEDVRQKSTEISSKLATGKSPPKKADDELSQPPPRAIIVR